MVEVSWNDEQQYATWLSRQTGKLYRLLTEAEWEYVSRSNTTTRYHFGNAIVKPQAQYSEGNMWSAGQTVPVGSFPANAWGLHDVHGNAWEWVQDCWNGSHAGAPEDGSARTSGDCGYRVIRGGGWNSLAPGLRSANRFWNPGERNYIIGFRLARTLDP